MSVAVEIVEEKTEVAVSAPPATTVVVVTEPIVYVKVEDSEDQLALTISETTTPVTVTTEPEVNVSIQQPAPVVVQVTEAADGKPGVKGDKGDPGVTSWAELSDKPAIPSALSEMAGDGSHRTVSDAEKSTWNGKEPAIALADATKFFQGDKTWFSPSTFGRDWLGLVSPVAARTALGLGTAAQSAVEIFATAAQGMLAASAIQPAGLASTLTNFQAKDTDLTALSGLGTAAYGRSLLTLANSSAGRGALGLGGVENVALSTWTGSTNLNTLGFARARTLGIGVPASETIPLVIGTLGAVNSNDPVILVSRNITGSGTYPDDDAHCFSDSSNFAKTGGLAYNSFDARITTSGIGNFNHYAAFQSIPDFNSTGITDDIIAYSSKGHVNAGTATRVSHFRACDYGGSGIVGTQYGLYIEPLTKGASNYGLFVDANINRFNGQIGINTDPIAPSHVLDIHTDTSTTKVMMGLGDQIGSGPLLYLQARNGSACGFHSRNGHNFTIESNTVVVMDSDYAGNFSFLGKLVAGGRIGAGVANPAEQIHSYLSGERGLRIETSSETGAIYQTFKNGGGNYFFGISNSSGGRLGSGGLPYSMQFLTESARALQLGTNNLVRMTIDDAGRVGIGTATPGSKLSIIGLPTSVSGLSTGDIWNDGGVLTIV